MARLNSFVAVIPYILGNKIIFKKGRGRNDANEYIYKNCLWKLGIVPCNDSFVYIECQSSRILKLMFNNFYTFGQLTARFKRVRAKGRRQRWDSESFHNFKKRIEFLPQILIF